MTARDLAHSLVVYLPFKQLHVSFAGTAINRVYVESVRRYRQLYVEVCEKIDGLLQSLKDGGGLGSVNTVGFDRSEYVKWNDKWYLADVKAYSSALLTQADGEFSQLSIPLMVRPFDFGDCHKPFKRMQRLLHQTVEKLVERLRGISALMLFKIQLSVILRYQIAVSATDSIL